jgi:putative transposase
MPSRNVVKLYVAEGVYHVYNRGVEKRDIFLDAHDYAVFLYYLKTYLLPPDLAPDDRTPRGLRIRLQKLELHRRIQLLAFCLMPNHFHLMLRQHDERAMSELMRRISNGYVEYFNRKYQRVGALFQGSYRAVLMSDEAQTVILSRYIHRNPVELLSSLELKNLADYPFSSYSYYLGQRSALWLDPRPVLANFSERPDDKSSIAYREFVESAEAHQTDSKTLSAAMLD